jgi:hypothetical protein
MRPDIYAEVGISSDPPEVEDGMFLRGQPLSQAMPEVLDFAVTHTPERPPRHFLELTIPVWSSQLHAAVSAGGAHNIDAYPATLRNTKKRLQWGGYFAVNIVGLLACAEMSISEFEVITERPSGVPYAKFDRLVLDSSLIKGVHIFRLAQDPGLLIITDHIVDALKRAAPTDGWGINFFPVEHA